MGVGVMKNSTPNSLPSNQMMLLPAHSQRRTWLAESIKWHPSIRPNPQSQQNPIRMEPVGVSVGTAKQAPPTTAGEPQKLKQEGQGGQQNGQQGTTQQTTSPEQTSTASPTEPTSPADQQQTLANTKEKTPMCLINELARYNKVNPNVLN